MRLQGASHPMFPDEDEALLEVWDDYGVVVHPQHFAMQHTAAAAGTLVGGAAVTLATPGATAAAFIAGQSGGSGVRGGMATGAMDVDMARVGVLAVVGEMRREKGLP